MRGIIGLAALAFAAPLQAHGLALKTTVFVERASDEGLMVQAARRFSTGDRVVTVLTWQAPKRANYTIVSPVPTGLALQSVSRDELEFSTNNGQSWRTLEDHSDLPSGVTHLRWRANGEGRLSYRAIVR